MQDRYVGNFGKLSLLNYLFSIRETSLELPGTTTLTKSIILAADQYRVFSEAIDFHQEFPIQTMTDILARQESRIADSVFPKGLAV